MHAFPKNGAFLASDPEAEITYLSELISSSKINSTQSWNFCFEQPARSCCLHRAASQFSHMWKVTKPTTKGTLTQEKMAAALISTVFRPGPKAHENWISQHAVSILCPKYFLYC